MVTVWTRLICLPIVCLLCTLPILGVLCLPVQTDARAAAPPAAAWRRTASARGAKNVKPTTVEVKEIERQFTRPVAPTPAAKETGPSLAAPEFLRAAPADSPEDHRPPDRRRCAR